jgi:amidohydrolase
MNLLSTIKDLAMKGFHDMQGFRHYLHQFPELSFEEEKTAGFLTSLFDRWQVPYRTGYAGNGIVALLKGEKSTGPCIALRADMDALPIQETTGLPYASTIPGLMHACGHDLHMASMLGTIAILKKLTAQFGGKVLFLFQPGEEKLPGGAKLMIEEGALADPVPSLILAQHVLPELETGKIGIRPGRYMASSDEIYITVRGKGGHAARPMDTTDNILAASRIIVALTQQFQSHLQEDYPSILAFGKISGAGATNVIPPEVFIEGTFRAMNEDYRMEMHHLFQSVAMTEAEALGARAEVEIRKGYPVLINHEKVSAYVKQFATQYLGKENVVEIESRMTSEDFAYFTQRMPACFYRLGTRSPNTQPARLHAPDFIVDEEALKTGSGCMAWLTLSFLAQT